MAEPPPPTILAHKTAFLTAQTLQLSQPLAPSHAWQQRNSNPGSSSTSEGAVPLSQKNLEDALFRFNHILQQHSRRVYAPQASRHVAEQVERLLIDSADRYIAGRREDEEGGQEGGEGRDDALRIGADLTSDTIISTLPQTWSAAHPKQAVEHPPEAKRYEDLASSLTSLSARRKQARQRVERLRKMKGLLQPFNSDTTQNEGGNGTSNVQQNLVTRNGDVEKELERMRMLLVRVSGRLAQLPPPGTRRQEGDVTMDDGDSDEVVEDLDVVERNKVDALLNGF